MADLTLKFGVQGDGTMKSALAAINSEIKGLDAEMKLAVSQMANMGSAEEKNALKGEILAKQYTANAQKLELLSKQYSDSKSKLETLGAELEKATSEFGENSVEVVKLQNEYNKQSKSTQDLATQMTKVKTEMQNAKNGMQETSEATKDAGEAMDKAKGSASTFGDMLKAKLTGEAVIAGIKKLGGALKDLALGTTQLADELATQSAITGLSTDTLQEYAYMAELVDTDVSTITGSLSKLAKNMASASKGTGAAHDAFKQLGISVTDSNGALRDNEDVFNEVIDVLGTIANETERDTIAMNLFGKSAQELNPLIKAGSKQIKAYAQEAHDMGYVLSKDVIKQNAAASDAIEKFKNAATGAKNAIGAAFAPAIEEAANAMTRMVQWGRENADIIKKLGEAIGVAVGAFVAYKVAAAAIELPTKAAAAAQTLLNTSMMANPIIAVTAALTALFVALDVFGRRTYEVSEDVVALRDEISATSEEVARQAEIWDSATAAQNRNIQGIQASFDYYEQLFDELTKITDENGKVQQGYEDRAEVISGILSDALGTEIKLSGGVIKNYQTLQKEIGKLIEKKKAELILKAQEETYTEALRSRQDAALKLIKTEEERKRANEKAATASADLTNLELELMELEKQGRNDYNAVYMKDLDARVAAKRKEVEELNAAADEANSSYEESKRIVSDTTYSIQVYEQNLQAVTRSEYDKIITANADVARSYNDLDVEGKAAMDSLTGNTAKLGADLYAGAETAGEDLVNGLIKGIENKKSSLQTTVANVGVSGKKWLKDSLDEASPSKATEEMGEFFVEGLEMGIKGEQKNLFGQIKQFGQNALGAFNKATSGGFNMNAGFQGGLQLASADGSPALINGQNTYVIKLQLDGREIATSTTQIQDQRNMAYNR